MAVRNVIGQRPLKFIGVALFILFLLTTVVAQPAMAAETELEEEGGHSDESEGEHGDHNDAGMLHLGIEIVQFVSGFAALAGVVLAGNLYGGKVGTALYVSGAGVGLFAIARLWHNLTEFGVLGTTIPGIVEQGVFTVVTVLLAAGYLLLWNTMRAPG